MGLKDLIKRMKEMNPKVRKYLEEADAADKKKVQIAIGEIKDKVKKIIAAIRDGYVAAAAKAVAEYSIVLGSPFTTELQTQMLVFKDNKQFLDSWREELAKQTAIYKELHPTDRKPEPVKKDEKPPSER